MNIDSVRDFRARLKEAFDYASTVGTVSVYRNNERFLLVSEDRVKAARLPQTDYQQEHAAQETSIWKRTTRDVLDEIDELKLVWKDDLDPTIVQDAETLASNKKTYGEQSQALWDEFNELKGQV